MELVVHLPGRIFETGSWSRAGADLRLRDSSAQLVAHQPAHSGSMKLLPLARPATPGRAGSGPREVCADYEAIGHVVLAVLRQVRSSLQAVAKHRPSALRLS